MEIVHSDTSFHCQKTSDHKDDAVSAELKPKYVFVLHSSCEFCLNENQHMKIMFLHSQINCSADCHICIIHVIDKNDRLFILRQIICHLASFSNLFVVRRKCACVMFAWTLFLWQYFV